MEHPNAKIHETTIKPLVNHNNSLISSTPNNCNTISTMHAIEITIVNISKTILDFSLYLDLIDLIKGGTTIIKDAKAIYINKVGLPKSKNGVNLTFVSRHKPKRIVNIHKQKILLPTYFLR